ncbi:hypothetical protein [Cupriavidus numazuensis]|uniref:hypothetical protein n=1 Tax=Cupriavidus numazuensis TaxID=221992 RepID=UPI001BAAEF11|nr:hypothetical protein [Cupriavidus numazuensis]
MPIVHAGESSWILPLVGCIAICLACCGHWKRAVLWLVTFGIGFCLMLAGKLAFELAGWSLPGLRLYSISGHAMLTSAVYPVLFVMAGTVAGPRAARFGLVAALVLVVVVALALVIGRYHTISETLAGAAIGLPVAWVNLRQPMVRLDSRVLAALAVGLVLVLVGGVRHAFVDLKKSALAHSTDVFGDRTFYSRRIQQDPLTGKTVITINRASASLDALSR